MIIVLGDEVYDEFEEHCGSHPNFYSIDTVRKMSNQMIDALKPLFPQKPIFELSLIVDLAFSEFQYSFNNDYEHHCVVIAVERSCYNPFLLFNNYFEVFMTKEQVYEEVFQIGLKILEKRGEKNG